MAKGGDMIINYKWTCSLLILVFLLGCSSNGNLNKQYDRLDVSNSVDIWNSIQYEIITDINTMKSIRSDVTDESYMFYFNVKLENRGIKTADEFQANFIEAIPLTYINGSRNQGIDKGKLDRNGKYELKGYFTFKSIDELKQFIGKSNILIEWVENEDNKTMILKFPSEPTQ